MKGLAHLQFFYYRVLIFLCIFRITVLLLGAISANSFIQHMACLRMLLSLPLAEQTFFVLVKSSVSIIYFKNYGFSVVSKGHQHT